MPTDAGAAALTTGGGTGVELVVFDVNETLSDLTGMAPRFEEVGAPGHLAATWFAAVLRDGFALTVVGAAPAFADVAAGVLRGVLTGQHLDRSLEEAVEHVLGGLAALELHPDVAPGVEALTERGLRLVTLSNWSASVAETLLGAAGVRDRFNRLLSVAEAGAWKPAPQAYAYALAECGVPAERAVLVAVHPWDVDGARRAGLTTCWLNRSGAPYPGVFAAADVEVASLSELAGHLRS